MDEREDLDKIREYIRNGELDHAIRYLANCIVVAAITPGADKSELYYLFGNAYRKKGDFDLAMNYYTLAIEHNPDHSAAIEARKALHGIMSFYNKDMYNH